MVTREIVPSASRGAGGRLGQGSRLNSFLEELVSVSGGPERHNNPTSGGLERNNNPTPKLRW